MFPKIKLITKFFGIFFFNKKKTNQVFFPDIISFQKDVSFEISYVDKSEELMKQKLNSQEINKICLALIEFQLLFKKKDNYKKGFFELLNNPILSIVRLGFKKRKEIGNCNFFNCLKIAFLGVVKQRRTNYFFLIHNDLLPNILYKRKKDQIYFIDFEKTILSRKWLFIDPIHLFFCFQNNRIKIKEEFWKEYLPKIKKKVEFSEINFFEQIRISILLRTLRRITSRSLPEVERKRYKKFLQEVLVPKKSFENWLEASRTKEFKKNDQ